MRWRRWVSDEYAPRRTIVDYLFDDAEKLDALVAEARAFGDEGFLDAARSSFAALARRLDRHMRLEEHAVLPRLPASASRRAAVLRREHGRLRSLVHLAQQLLDDGDGATFARAVGRLGDANRRHERKERRLFASVREEI
jgi:hypothetical protein